MKKETDHFRVTSWSLGRVVTKDNVTAITLREPINRRYRKQANRDINGGGGRSGGFRDYDHYLYYPSFADCQRCHKYW